MKKYFCSKNVDNPNGSNLFQRLVCIFLMAVVLSHIVLPSVAVAAECVKTGSICVEPNQTRNINGTSVTKECWRYEDTYQCTTAISGQKSCDPLFNKTGCGQSFTNCLESDINGQCIKFTRDFSCSSDLKLDYAGVLPTGITELPPTHEITTSWDDTDCKNKGANLTACNSVNTTCTSGEATKVINGVSVTQPCWENTIEYSCLNSTTNTACDAAVDNGCVATSTSCLNIVNGVCQVSETRYKCQVRPATTETSDSCKDQDFAKAMTGLESSREFARYYDENSATFFKGTDSRCSIKLGGELGGNCCKTSESADKWTDAAISAGVQYGISQALASTYTYEILIAQSSQIMSSVAASASAMGLGTSVAPSVSTAGVGVSTTATGQTVIMLNPAMLAVAIALYLLTQWLACDDEEKKVAIRKKAGTCHFIGSYCSSKFLGACVSKKQSYCCFISKLAKIINEGGREQLGKSWGTAESPNCSGFTSSDMEKIDFSKLNLDEFLNDIKYKALDSAKAFTSNQNSASSQVQKALGGYYGQ